MSNNKFIIFPDGTNLNQVKNQAKIIKKDARNNGQKLVHAEILNEISQKLTGQNYKTALKNIEKTAPYSDSETELNIPFSDENNNVLVKITTNESNSTISIDDVNLEISVNDLIFFQKYESIRKIKNGWMLDLYVSEQAKAMDGYTEDTQAYFEVIQIKDGIALNFLIAEYNPLYNGYEPTIVKTELFLWSDLKMNQIKKKKTNIESFAKELESTLEVYEILSLYNEKNYGDSVAFYKDGKYFTLDHDSLVKWVKDEKIEIYTEHNSFGVEYRYIHPIAEYDSMGYDTELEAMIGAVEQLYLKI